MTTPQTRTFAMWQRLAGRPLGKRLFSTAMALRVPYFGTILPTVTEMRPGYCAVRAPKWWGVHNHLGTFHAIAACNLAEVAMGMLAEATVPATHRWIPKSMTVDYLAKREPACAPWPQCRPLRRSATRPSTSPCRSTSRTRRARSWCAR